MISDNGIVIPKTEAQWDDNDYKKLGYNWKAQNILISALGVDEFYRVSLCETAKAIWDALQVIHEGTNEVKQARTNTLDKEFELFHMKHGETIADMQKRFTHLINRLNAPGNPISNATATYNILRCLTRD
ncbi:uncharacterized protein LOC131605501 [Vicia villosa]|uniref:uncharacterized protein LOC131605501 n=1 Tax=Vicia villosa TaxID=3911 RepID=UPI00273ABE86|nr:uncharacterized protein LOC131605501 [Vicia villosa]